MPVVKTGQKFLLALILLAAAFAAYKIADAKRKVYAALPKQGSVVLSGKAVDSLFRGVLNRYTLGDSVLKKIKSPLKRNDSLFASYRVSLPRDIPVPLFISHLQQGFPAGSLEIVAGEKEVNGGGWIELYSGTEMKLYAELRPNKKWERKNGSVLFLVSDIENADDKTLDAIAGSSEVFTVIVKPPYNSALISTLQAQHKTLIPQAASGKEHIDYLFQPSYSPQRIRESLRAYQTKFPGLTHILIRPETEIFKSTAYASVKAQLQSAGCTLIPGNEIYTLKNAEGIQAEKKLNDWLKLSDSKNFVTVEISASQFTGTASLRESLRRRGIKFLTVTKSLFN